MQISSRLGLTLWGGLLCLFLWGGRAWALTLGEPRVVVQNPPHWVVEVPLADAGTVRPEQIQVRLAAPAFWQAAGLKPIDPQSVRVNPNPKEGVVSFELTAPAGFVDVLIELQWPNGILQRALGVLLVSPAPVLTPPLGGAGQVLVQPGDTASQLVAPELDASDDMAQGLQALLQLNPEAFVAGNVNRLRAGALLKLPSPAEIKAIDPELASKALAQQIEAFALYRAEVSARREAQVDDAAQVATGKVQPAHRDKVEPPADRLTLSVPDADAQSDRIAQQKQAQQSAERAAELNRNIQDLNRLAQSDGAALPLPAPVPGPQASEGIDRLVDHPLTPWAAGGLLLALVAWVMVRALRQPKSLTNPTEAEPTLAPLPVDFDLDLPPVDQLPELPPDVSRPPTPVDRSASFPPASGVSAGPAVGADPMAGLSLDLPDLGAVPELDMPSDPWVLRFKLAQALHLRGLTQTALVLAREVAAQAPAPLAQDARVWLDERV